MKDTKYIAKVELIEKALEAYKKDLIEKIEKMKKKKTGFANIKFGSGDESKIPIESNYDAGYNQAIDDLIKIIKEG